MAITPIRAIGPIGTTIDIMIGIMIGMAISIMVGMTTIPIAGITAATIGRIIMASMIILTQAIARIGIGTDSLPNRKIRLLPFCSSTLQML